MNDPALLDAAAANLAAHFTWVQRHAPGMRVREGDGLVLTDCGMPCDTFNAACFARLPPGDADARVREAIAWFGAHPFSWWLSPGDTPDDLGARLAAAGLEAAESELAMTADLGALPAEQVPGGLEIRRARSADELADFAAISAANWSPPDAMVVRFYQLGAKVLLSDNSPLRFYVGYLHGVAVAASEATIAGGVVGLYNISTREAYRGRRIGSAMTLRPLVEAARAGLRTAILQAAPDGVGVYRRIGFTEFGSITEYKPQRSPAT